MSCRSHHLFSTLISFYILSLCTTSWSWRLIPWQTKAKSNTRTLFETKIKTNRQREVVGVGQHSVTSVPLSTEISDVELAEESSIGPSALSPLPASQLEQRRSEQFHIPEMEEETAPSESMNNLEQLQPLNVNPNTEISPSISYSYIPEQAFTSGESHREPQEESLSMFDSVFQPDIPFPSSNSKKDLEGTPIPSQEQRIGSSTVFEAIIPRRRVRDSDSTSSVLFSAEPSDNLYSNVPVASSEATSPSFQRSNGFVMNSNDDFQEPHEISEPHYTPLTAADFSVEASSEPSYESPQQFDEDFRASHESFDEEHDLPRLQFSPSHERIEVSKISSEQSLEPDESMEHTYEIEESPSPELDTGNEKPSDELGAEGVSENFDDHFPALSSDRNRSKEGFQSTRNGDKSDKSRREAPCSLNETKETDIGPHQLSPSISPQPIEDDFPLGVFTTPAELDLTTPIDTSPIISPTVTFELDIREPIHASPIASPIATFESETAEPIDMFPIISPTVTFEPETAEPIDTSPIIAPTVTFELDIREPIHASPIISPTITFEPDRAEPIDMFPIISPVVTFEPDTRETIDMFPIISPTMTFELETAEPIDTSPIISPTMTFELETAEPIDTSPIISPTMTFELETAEPIDASPIISPVVTFGPDRAEPIDASPIISPIATFESETAEPIDTSPIISPTMTFELETAESIDTSPIISPTMTFELETAGPIDVFPITSPVITFEPNTREPIDVFPIMSPIMTFEPDTEATTDEFSITSPIATFEPDGMELIDASPIISPIATFESETAEPIDISPIISPIITEPIDAFPIISPIATFEPDGMELIDASPFISPIVTEPIDASPIISPIATFESETAEPIDTSPIISPTMTFEPDTRATADELLIMSPTVTLEPGTTEQIDISPTVTEPIDMSPIISPTMTFEPDTRKSIDVSSTVSPIVTFEPDIPATTDAPPIASPSAMIETDPMVPDNIAPTASPGAIVESDPMVPDNASPTVSPGAVIEPDSIVSDNASSTMSPDAVTESDSMIENEMDRQSQFSDGTRKNSMKQISIKTNDGRNEPSMESIQEIPSEPKMELLTDINLGHVSRERIQRLGSLRKRFRNYGSIKDPMMATMKSRKIEDDVCTRILDGDGSDGCTKGKVCVATALGTGFVPGRCKLFVDNVEKCDVKMCANGGVNERCVANISGAGVVETTCGVWGRSDFVDCGDIICDAICSGDVRDTSGVEYCNRCLLEMSSCASGFRIVAALNISNRANITN